MDQISTRVAGTANLKGSLNENGTKIFARAPDHKGNNMAFELLTWLPNYFAVSTLRCRPQLGQSFQRNQCRVEYANFRYD